MINEPMEDTAKCIPTKLSSLKNLEDKADKITLECRLVLEKIDGLVTSLEPPAPDSTCKEESPGVKENKLDEIGKCLSGGIETLQSVQNRINRLEDILK